MNSSLDIAITNYISLLKDELCRRLFTDDEIKSLIQISGIEECILKFLEESLHYPIESTADEVLQIVCKKAMVLSYNTDRSI